MATMVCRGLQSCLDRRNFIFPSDQCHIQNPSPLTGIPSSDARDGGWSFLQSLAGGVDPSASKQESVYVHPLTKRFNPTGLSENSLNLCTENLGNETGSDITENSILSPEIDGEDLQRKWERKPNLNSHSSFHQYPPPLTTISETESFTVRPRREEGRLIIAAVRAPARVPCFQVERSGGRLRLCFVETEVDGGEEEEEEEEESGEEMETVAMINEGNEKEIRKVNLKELSTANC